MSTTLFTDWEDKHLATNKFRAMASGYSPFAVLTVDEEVVVEEELREEEVVVQVEEVLEEVVEAGRSPSMSPALWECDRQRALMGSKPSCGREKP